MIENGDRLTEFEKRLDSIGEDVRVLKDDVRVLKDDVRVLKDDVGVLKQDVSTLKDDVQRLRVLQEDQETRIDKIAEVQAHHGQVLDEHGKLLLEIKDQLAPLADIAEFVRRTSGDHERRIVALEKRTGLQEPG